MLRSLAIASAQRRCASTLLPKRTYAVLAPHPGTADYSEPKSERKETEDEKGAREKQEKDAAREKVASEGPLRPHYGIAVAENHGLYAFFRKVPTKDGGFAYETVGDIAKDNYSGACSINKKVFNVGPSA